jgi:N-acetyl-anhydromuramoyl-L-alanine amidase
VKPLIAAVQRASPNFDARPSGIVIDLLVLHYISLPANRFSGTCVEDFFLNRLDTTKHPSFSSLKEVRVSAHFFLRRTGQLFQFVRCEDRAWHAGVSRFLDRSRCNDFSIGIEIEGSSDVAFTPTQYRVLGELVKKLCKTYPLKYVAGHSDIAPGRKDDPGPHFDWIRFHQSIEKTPLIRPF